MGTDQTKPARVKRQPMGVPVALMHLWIYVCVATLLYWLYEVVTASGSWGDKAWGLLGATLGIGILFVAGAVPLLWAFDRFPPPSPPRDSNQ
jgi:hypothetical protein